MIKTTCKDCPPKTQKYCRSKSIAKNSYLCRLAQEHRYNKGNSLIQDIKNLFRNRESTRGESKDKGAVKKARKSKGGSQRRYR